MIDGYGHGNESNRPRLWPVHGQDDGRYVRPWIAKHG